MELPPLPRILIRALLRLTLVAIFLGLPLALVWARVVGIGWGLPERVAGLLDKGPFQASIGKITFDMVEGFVAEDIAIADRRTGAQVAALTRLALSLNLADLLRGRVGIERLSLARADGVLPLTAGEAGSVELRFGRMTGELRVVDDFLRLSGFSAELEGIRIEGEALLRLGARGVAQPGGDSEPIRRAVEAAKLLAKLRYPERPPVIRAVLSGELDRPRLDSLEISAGPVEGPGWRIEGAEAAASYAGGELLIQRFVVQDQKGRLQLWGSLRGGEMRLEGYGSLDPVPFLRAAGRGGDVAGLAFSNPPQVTFEAAGRLEEGTGGLAVTGSFAAEGLRYRDVGIDSLRADFAWRRDRFFARGIEMRAGSSKATGDLLVQPGDFRAKLAGTLNPPLFSPWLDPRVRETLRLFEFRQTPRLKLSLRGPSPKPASLKGTGEIDLGPTAMRGVWADRIRSSVAIADGAVHYRGFEIEMGGGRATGNFTYDFANQLVRIEGVNSRVQPVDLLMWADPKIAETLRPYRFVAPPNVKADGVVFMKDIARNNLDLRVDAPKGLDYDLLGKTLRFGRTAASVRLDGAMVRARVSSAELMKGTVQVSADVSVDPARPGMEVDVRGRGIDFPMLTKTYFDYESSKGVASGRFRFAAKTGSELDMTGNGSVRVEDGNVFAIPLLGPLSEVIDKILPGAGYETARLATADFRVADRKIHTPNLEIEGKGFSLFGEGSIGFPRGEMDMAVRINARGLPGLFLFPVSKLFEYVSDGTFSNPGWRPKIIPRLPAPRGQDP